MIKILVSIVNYNSYKDTFRVINFIKNSLNTKGFQINFFIIDNGDKTKQYCFLSLLNNIENFLLVDSVEGLRAGENYIVNSKNNGFGAANNITIDHLNKVDGYDAVWMLNSDLKLDYSSLSGFKRYILGDIYNILGSVIVEKDNTIYGTDNTDSFKGYGSPSGKKINQPIFEVDAVSGTSMIFKAQVLQRFKFDENYFMYVEENDLCYRFNQIGVKSYIVSSSKVYHTGGKTFGNNQSLRWYYKVRNLLYFKKKNNSKNILLIPYLLLITLKNYKLDRSYLKAYYYGVVDYINDSLGETSRNFL
jgi:GT2 family glycosyltransferase